MTRNDCPHRRQAETQIMRDLIDCLWAEDFFGREVTRLESANAWLALYRMDASRPPVTWTEPSLTWRWRLRHRYYRAVLVPVRPGIAQPLHSVAGAPVYAITRRDRQIRLNPMEWMTLVIEALGDDMPGSKVGGELFLETLRITLRQSTWSVAHRIRTANRMTLPPAGYFQAMEQWGALRDRPFHPVAKAKLGLDSVDYHHYAAEFDQTIALKWVAIRRDYLLAGEGVPDPNDPGPAGDLLTPEQADGLSAELDRRGLRRDWLAIPVLPWQLQHGLPPALHDAGREGHWVALDFNAPAMKSTSSVRSLAPLTDSPNYLKLPMSIHSLGSSRYLPAVKMINGVIAEKLLRRALTLDTELQARVHLCDETRWWAYMPKNASLFDDAPRHLSAMVRRYPARLLREPNCRLVPMSALGTVLPDRRAHVFDDWLAQRGLPANDAAVLGLFREVCDCFLAVNLRLFRLGILPEIHGQNAVLLWRDRRPDGLLLRDHDSLRLFVPWLNRAGLADPVFRLKPGVANTLYHDTAEDLLFYLLTLGIQVNLRAIIDALAHCYRLDETRLWRQLSHSLAGLIESLDFSDEARALLRRACFENREWPLKLLIRPLLERAGGPGSMPFGKGRIANPLHRLTARSTPPVAKNGPMTAGRQPDMTPCLP